MAGVVVVQSSHMSSASDISGAPWLAERELRKLTRRVAAPNAEEPFGAYVFWHDEPGAALGRHVERAVLLEAFGDTPDVLAAEYGPYESSSFFICVIDHIRSVPAGIMRVILPFDHGLKSLNDMEPVWGVSAEELVRRTGLAMDPRNTWDIATLAVTQDYRKGAAGGLVGMGLYQTIALASRRFDVEWIVAILDMPVYKMLRWKLRMMFSGFEGIEPRPYLGSPASIPAWCDVVATERQLAENDPDLHAIMERGVGLEAGLRRVDLDGSERFLSAVTEWRLQSLAPQTPASSSFWTPSEATTSGSRVAPTGRE